VFVGNGPGPATSPGVAAALGPARPRRLSLLGHRLLSVRWATVPPDALPSTSTAAIYKNSLWLMCNYQLCIILPTADACNATVLLLVAATRSTLFSNRMLLSAAIRLVTAGPVSNLKRTVQHCAALNDSCKTCRSRGDSTSICITQACCIRLLALLAPNAV
jgi:hypothetical protein